ncbi:MAG: polyprenol monophosphomannose synthase [Candidatus Marinimicrobia bacterium]|nr:polyprenol monophosphomannose synthase [Candidatus Neomarinimicrobiota bacterium]
MKILVISPTYNERKNIKRLVDMVLGENPEFHLLIVDDNSPDGTGRKVEKLQKKYTNLFLETRSKKYGLGTAYIFGFKWALKDNYDYVIQMDADLSHNPKDLSLMVKKLKEYDLVIGSRYIKGISVVNWPLRRLMLSYGANAYSRVVTGMPIMDGTGGFKAWKSNVLASIDLDSVKSQGYSFQIEMNFRAWVKGYKIKEIPIIFSDRTIGQSKMSRTIVYEAIFMVWRLRIWKIFKWHS